MKRGGFFLSCVGMFFLFRRLSLKIFNSIVRGCLEEHRSLAFRIVSLEQKLKGLEWPWASVRVFTPSWTDRGFRGAKKGQDLLGQSYTLGHRAE